MYRCFSFQQKKQTLGWWDPWGLGRRRKQGVDSSYTYLCPPVLEAQVTSGTNCRAASGLPSTGPSEGRHMDRRPEGELRGQLGADHAHHLCRGRVHHQPPVAELRRDGAWAGDAPPHPPTGPAIPPCHTSCQPVRLCGAWRTTFKQATTKSLQGDQSCTLQSVPGNLQTN